MQLIGIGGVARAGKDTLCKLLQKHYFPNAQRVALADELKFDIDPFLKEKTGISAWTTDPTKKTLIRDMLVAYGKVKRQQTGGTYWTNLAQSKVNACKNIGMRAIVTDIRYNEFEFDELYWLKNFNKGFLIHLSRIDEDGQLVPPANNDEKLNDSLISKAADIKICWPTVSDMETLVDYLPKTLLENLQ
jgi:hypothetical protein